MKKFLLFTSTLFILLVGALSISSSAERYTYLPITIVDSGFYQESYFTLTSFSVDVYQNETPQYTNTASVYLEGTFNQGYNINLVFYCYNASGNHLKTIKQYTTSSDFSDGYAYFDLTVPDVTATIEVAAENPTAWSNTYFYSNYINVYSEDGRSMGIHDLLLPVYENSGWHGNVWMYALDGRSIEVPYCDIEAYKNVGWYLWEDYRYLNFKRDYQSYVNSGDYSNAFYEIEYALSSLEGTYYESSLYEYKTKLMDAWRKKINGPLAYLSSYTKNGETTIYFRNVSYKPIKAFKLQFDCYNVFGQYLDPYYHYYYISDTWLDPCEEDSFVWESIPYSADHISNVRITQVVYSDGTSWYR